MPLLLVAPHLFTSRAISVSRHAGDPATAAVAESLRMTPSGIVQVHQVHGSHVTVARRGLCASVAPEADVIVTNDAARAVGVRVADCAPILMADRAGRVVAAVHAGWRGTAANAAVAAVRALAHEFGLAAADVIVAIGPLIRSCCYEVGPAVRAAFAQGDAERWFSPGRGDRLQLDVATANRDQLETAGVPAAQIFDSGLCTACHPNVFFSYRREGSSAGRLFGAIRPSP